MNMINTVIREATINIFIRTGKNNNFQKNSIITRFNKIKGT